MYYNVGSGTICPNWYYYVKIQKGKKHMTNTGYANLFVVKVGKQVQFSSYNLFQAEQYCRHNGIPFGYLFVVERDGSI